MNPPSAEQAVLDAHYMARALELARNGRYTTHPNPRVGCVIVRDGQIVGEGWHVRTGEPHAEVHALRAAGDQARGATAYVTLEPCSHYGHTPPCADALVSAGLARVVAAMQDPNPEVAGRGMQRLAQAGIEVRSGVLEGEARALLARLGPDPIDEQIAVIQHAVERTPGSTSLRELRGSQLGLQPIVWTGILLAAFQQLVGISVVKTYSNTIWQAVGFSTASAFTISMATVLVSIVSTVVAIGLMDRIARRTLLSIGAAVMAISLSALAWSFSTATGNGQELSLDRAAGISALVAINVFAVAFGITWGPVMWLMLSELFDTHVRVTAVGVCTAVNWLTNWAVSRMFPVLAGSGLELAYGLYAAFAALAFLFALRVLPETRGRNLS